MSFFIMSNWILKQLVKLNSSLKVNEVKPPRESEVIKEDRRP